LSRTYRDQDEVNKWLANDKDPLLRFEQYLFDNSIIDNQKTEALNNEVDSVVKESVSFAVNSPLPDLSSAFNNMIA
jgi:pyruvate dehydrogenase E1 component alpha subunit